MNIYSISHAFVISVTDSRVVLLLLLSLYCIDLFSCKAASVFIINLFTYLLTRNLSDYSLAVCRERTMNERKQMRFTSYYTLIR